jgi:hypothetical protein
MERKPFDPSLPVVHSHLEKEKEKEKQRAEKEERAKKEHLLKEKEKEREKEKDKEREKEREREREREARVCQEKENAVDPEKAKEDLIPFKLTVRIRDFSFYYHLCFVIACFILFF